MNILILLIGSNPLPNYVVAAYLLKKEREDRNDLPVPDKIILVHSKETKDFSIKIIDKLNISPISNSVDLGEEERNPSKIKSKLSNILNKIKENLSKDNKKIVSINLNYTGGTKPMAVNCFDAVKIFSKIENIGTIYTDLDPDKFKIITENKSFPMTKDLREHIKLTIKDIFELHDMQISKNGEIDKTFSTDITNEQYCKFYKTATERYFAGNKEKSIFNDFKNKYEQKGRTEHQVLKNLKKEKRDNNGKIIRPSILNDSFIEIVNEFPSISLLFDSNHKIKKKYFFPFVKYFSGEWLEDLVLDTLLKLKNDIGKDINEVKKDIKASKNNRPTQIDLIVMRGYQMFLISCTTSQHIGIVKQKAFEAIYRADQLGGEHAKVILISTMYPDIISGNDFTLENNINMLKNDIPQFHSKEHCYLIGIDKLIKETKAVCSGINSNNSLSDELKRIIKG